MCTIVLSICVLSVSSLASCIYLLGCNTNYMCTYLTRFLQVSEERERNCGSPEFISEEVGWIFYEKQIKTDTIYLLFVVKT